MQLVCVSCSKPFGPDDVVYRTAVDTKTHKPIVTRQTHREDIGGIAALLCLPIRHQSVRHADRKAIISNGLTPRLVRAVAARCGAPSRDQARVPVRVGPIFAGAR
jgi:hypothetical protein